MLPLQLKAQRFGTLLAALSPGETHKQAIPCNWDHKGVEGPLEKGLSVGNPMRHVLDCKLRRSSVKLLNVERVRLILGSLPMLDLSHERRHRKNHHAEL